MPTWRALITGAGGQDGSFLASLLPEQGYDGTEIVRRLCGRAMLVRDFRRGRFGPRRPT